MSVLPIDPVIVPAKEGKAFVVAPGQYVRVIDVEGGQAADLFAFCADDPQEYLSASHTRVACQRVFPAVGEPFVSGHRRPMLTLVEDSSPGQHDLLLAACDATRYRLLGVDEHANCEDNLRKALDEYGIEAVTTPQPVNLFTNVPPQPDGRLPFLPSDSRAGDSVTFRAEMELIVVVSACPQDLTPINHGHPSSIGVAVSDGESFSPYGPPA